MEGGKAPDFDRENRGVDTFDRRLATPLVPIGLVLFLRVSARIVPSPFALSAVLHLFFSGRFAQCSIHFHLLSSGCFRHLVPWCFRLLTFR